MMDDESVSGGVSCCTTQGEEVVPACVSQISNAQITPRIQTIIRKAENQPEIIIQLEAELSNNCYNQDQPDTGHALWFGAENMCCLLDQLWHNNHQDCDHDDPGNYTTTPNSLLELGAGPGLAGIYAAKLWTESLQTVVLTDGSEAVVELLQRNIQRNHVAECCSAEVLVWGQSAMANHEFLLKHALPHGFPIILGADLIYGKSGSSTETIQLLFQTAHQLLSDSGRFYLAFTRRNVSISIVLTEAQAQGFVYELMDDFVYDIFDNNVDGITDFWRDAIYCFHKRDGNDRDLTKNLEEAIGETTCIKQPVSKTVL